MSDFRNSLDHYIPVPDYTRGHIAPKNPHRQPLSVENWMPPDSGDLYWEHKRAGRELSYGLDQIEYRYNSLGYRAPEVEIKANPFMMNAAIGCSITEGIGLPVEHTWAHQVQVMMRETLDDSVVYNLGVGGSCNEAIYFRALNAMTHLGAGAILVQWTYPHRRLHATDQGINDWWWPDQGELKQKRPDAELKARIEYYKHIQSDHDDVLRLLMMARHLNDISLPHGCKIIQYFGVPVQVMPDIMGEVADRLPFANLIPMVIEDRARDLSHPGQKTNSAIAEFFRNELQI